jgi:ParB/RepB/Spo0J family partition protein
MANEMTVTTDMSTVQTENVSIDLIDLDTTVRTKPVQEAIDELAASINEVGLLQPPAVKPAENGRFQIVFGVRRIQAAKHLGWESIAVRVIDRGDARLIGLVENLQRKDLPIPDLALAVKNIVDTGRCSMTQIGHASGRKKSWVSKTAKLGAVVEQLKPQGVSFTKLKMSTYFELLDTPELIVMAEDGNWTQKAARMAAKQHVSGERPKPGQRRRHRQEASRLRPTDIASYVPVTTSDRGFTVEPFVFDKSTGQDIEAVIEKLQELQYKVEVLIAVLHEHQATPSLDKHFTDLESEIQQVVS